MESLLRSKIAYSVLKPLLFRLEPELAHAVAMRSLGLFKPFLKTPSVSKRSIDLMGLKIPHRAGLAAGFDKNGDCIDLLFKLGFSFVEVGTVTPKKQVGNSKPRVFRLPEQESMINSMGFPNHGIQALKRNLKRRKHPGIVGVNIGKNKETPLEHSHKDYVACLKALYSDADYFVVNVSSPNTLKLRELQKAESFSKLVRAITDARKRLEDCTGTYRPIAYKVSPDLNVEALKQWVGICLELGVDGIVSANTTIDRPDGLGELHQGGLSGRLLRSRSEACLESIIAQVGNELPVISVGGIANKVDGQKRIDMGATAFQIFTGFIYRGPRLVGELARI